MIFAKSWDLSKKKQKSSQKANEWRAVFHPEFLEDLRYWIKVDRKAAIRALDIVESVLKNPFTGIAKPEPLKYLPTGTWSRRLTQEHRIVYLLKNDHIHFLQARYHY